MDLKVKVERFLSLKTDKCVFYPVINRAGYGDIQYRDKFKNKRHYLAHRLVFELVNNIKLTKDNIIMHVCDNPSCCNPKHLKIGTHFDNVKDRDSKGRQAKGSKNAKYKNGYYSKYEHNEKPKPKFESLFSRSLKREDVILIKEKIKNRGSKKLIEIADELNVKYQTIRDISNGRAYLKIN